MATAKILHSGSLSRTLPPVPSGDGVGVVRVVFPLLFVLIMKKLCGIKLEKMPEDFKAEPPPPNVL